MSLKCVKTHLINSTTQNCYLARFALFLVPSARSALSHLLYARCPSDTPALKRTHSLQKAHFGRGRNKRAALTMCDPVTLILSASPAAPSRSSRRAHRKCPDVQHRRFCVEERVRWVGGADTHRRSWGGMREGGWTGRSAGRCVCPSQEELPPREESHPVWRSQTCGANSSKSIRDAIRLPIRIQFIWLQAKHVFISADMMEQCRIII